MTLPHNHIIFSAKQVFPSKQSTCLQKKMDIRQDLSALMTLPDNHIIFLITNLPIKTIDLIAKQKEPFVLGQYHLVIHHGACSAVSFVGICIS